jgi:pimeloyl-ACP methyl ester carboxylesterase
MPVDQVNGTPLAYEVSGPRDAETIVLVHGSWNGRHIWASVVERLADAYQVVCYDRRGHGESDASPAAGTVHDDVTDLAALIEATSSGPAYVVGNSYGACIALRLAAEQPEVVRAVVGHEPPFVRLLDATPEGTVIAVPVWEALAEVRRRLESADYAGAAEYFVEHVALGLGAWSMMPPEVQQLFIANAPTYLGELRDPDAWTIDLAELASIAKPVLLTQGDHSPPFLASVIEIVAGNVPGVRRDTIPGAGHVPHVTHSDAYSDIIRTFFGTLRPRQ